MSVVSRIDNPQPTTLYRNGADKKDGPAGRTIGAPRNLTRGQRSLFTTVRRDIAQSSSEAGVQSDGTEIAAKPSSNAR
ncbi:MAG TPA: hypothetical protein VLE46_06745 [Nitrospira sp.]|nr:hypothetical protein [Nitrospira sp.]